jgi:hypothetical protein
VLHKHCKSQFLEFKCNMLAFELQVSQTRALDGA